MNNIKPFDTYVVENCGSGDCADCGCGDKLKKRRKVRKPKTQWRKDVLAEGCGCNKKKKKKVNKNIITKIDTFVNESKAKQSKEAKRLFSDRRKGKTITKRLADSNGEPVEIEDKRFKQIDQKED